MRGKRSLAVAAAAVGLLGLAWYLRDAHDGSKPVARPDKSPGLLPQQTSKAATDPSRRDNIHPPPSSEKSQGSGDAVERLVSSIDWVAFGGSVLAFTQEQEQARRESRKANYDAGTIEILSKNNLALQKIAELLGIQELREAPFHERVWPSYQRGWLKAAGVDLSSAQDADLGEAARVFARSRVEEQKTMNDSNRLEKLAWEAERGLRWDLELQRLLTPDQFAQVAKPAGSDPFWGRQAARQEFSLGSAEQSAQNVGAFWQATLGLNETQRTLVAGPATDFVQEVGRQVSGFRAQFPDAAPREEEMRLRISLLRLQARAERQLAVSLGLSPEQREGVEQGSGAVVDWRWK